MPRLVDAYLGWRYPRASDTAEPTVPQDPRASNTVEPTVPQDPRATPSGAEAPPNPPGEGLSPAEEQPSPAPTRDPDEVPSATTSPAVDPMHFVIDVLDVFTTTRTASISSGTALSPAEALVMNGYVGATPVSPSIAIALPTLELLRRVRLYKASFSLEAFAKLVCYYYSVR